MFLGLGLNLGQLLNGLANLIFRGIITDSYYGQGREGVRFYGDESQ